MLSEETIKDFIPKSETDIYVNANIRSNRISNTLPSALMELSKFLKKEREAVVNKNIFKLNVTNL